VIFEGLSGNSIASLTTRVFKRIKDLFSPASFASLYAPDSSFGIVKPCVFATCHKLKILNMIICAVSVKVMNYFVWLKLSLNMFFHYKDVLKDIVTVRCSSRVPVASDTNISVMVNSPALPIRLYNSRFDLWQHWLSFVPRWTTTIKLTLNYFGKFLLGFFGVRDASIPGRNPGFNSFICRGFPFQRSRYFQTSFFGRGFTFIPRHASFFEMRSAGIVGFADSLKWARDAFMRFAHLAAHFFRPCLSLIPNFKRFPGRFENQASLAYFLFDVPVLLLLATHRAWASVSKMVFKITPTATPELLGIDWLSLRAFGADGSLSSFDFHEEMIVNHQGGYK